MKNIHNNKKISVSVGIAAYNSERNIAHILTSLLKQKTDNYDFEKIVIHSDASTDRTVDIVKKFDSQKIKIINNKNRKGFAGSVKKLLETIQSDIIVLLNDDIEIRDVRLISKLINPFLYEKNLGLVCGNPQPLPPTNFIERAAVASSYTHDRMRKYIKNGNSKYSSDGKIMVLSRELVKKINFPTELNEMGNADTFIYLSCIDSGFKFRFLENAVVFCRMPQNIKDLSRWQIRNNSNRFILRKRFKTLVDKEYAKPPLLFWTCMIPEVFKNPAGCIFIFFFSLYVIYQGKRYAKNFNPTWDLIETSKRISKYD
ncbi:MAG: glycosyl transferase family protein [uncultured bacterium]|nr:MAG: glycosyl transferase family protein [uncultured bacterium]OGH13853.1 MAG: hypothetical protein A2687_04805 [Candidatus Levybacteria bacterium RIFCSPHIGHO2_01_FULL_38_26]